MELKRYPYIFLLAAVIFTSCGKSDEQVLQKTQQEQEIAELKQRLAVINKQLRDRPDDVREEVSKTKQRLVQLDGKISKHEDELMVVRGEKISIEQAFEDYREKHPIQ